MNISIDTLIFTSVYVLILVVISHWYYIVGYRRGISETVISLKRFENDAVDRALRKMQAENLAMEAHDD